MSNNNPSRQRMLLTCIKIVAAGPVKMNGGKTTGTRHHVTMAEDKHGQFWAARPESLKNFPLNEPRWYEVEPLESYGARTLKFYPVATDALTDDEKEQRRAYMASRIASAEVAVPAVEVSKSATPSSSMAVSPSSLPQPAVSDVHNTIVSAAAVLGAVILVAAGREEFDEIVPTAAILKKDMHTILEL